MIRLVRALTSDPILLAETAPPGPRRLHQITELFVRVRHDHLLGLDYQSIDDLRKALDSLPAKV